MFLIAKLSRKVVRGLLGCTRQAWGRWADRGVLLLEILSCLAVPRNSDSSQARAVKMEGVIFPLAAKKCASGEVALPKPQRHLLGGFTPDQSRESPIQRTSLPPSPLFSWQCPSYTPPDHLATPLLFGYILIAVGGVRPTQASRREAALLSSSAPDYGTVQLS